MSAMPEEGKFMPDPPMQWLAASNGKKPEANKHMASRKAERRRKRKRRGRGRGRGKEGGRAG